MDKIKLFISQSEEDLPNLSSELVSKNTIGSMLRIYFNDNDFIISKDKLKNNYFNDKDNLQNI